MDPFLGEIRCFSFGRIPRGWLTCSGQTLNIIQYQPLFALIGISFGGDGRTTFKLPNLNGVTPMHYNPTPTPPNPQTSVGATGGSEKITLNLTQTPPHNHLIKANTATADQTLPANNYPAALPSPHLAFADAGSAKVNMATDFVSTTGGDQPHPNMQPYLVVNFCIATQGVWPARP